MTICLSEDNMPTILTRTDRPIRPLPEGCDKQGRYETRTRRVIPFPDTMQHQQRGSADAIGDDQSERTSRWGSLPECKPDPKPGAKPDDDKDDGAPKPSAWWTLLMGLLCIAAVAACAYIANSLPHVGG